MDHSEIPVQVQVCRALLTRQRSDLVIRCEGIVRDCAMGSERSCRVYAGLLSCSPLHKPLAEVTPFDGCVRAFSSCKAIARRSLKRARQPSVREPRPPACDRAATHSTPALCAKAQRNLSLPIWIGT